MQHLFKAAPLPFPGGEGFEPATPTPFMACEPQHLAAPSFSMGTDPAWVPPFSQAAAEGASASLVTPSMGAAVALVSREDVDAVTGVAEDFLSSANDSVRRFAAGLYVMLYRCCSIPSYESHSE